MRVGMQREQWVVLVFEIDGHRYAIDSEAVLEIVRAVQPTRLPKAPPVVFGLIDARGELLPLIDLRLRFGHVRTPIRAHEAFVLVQAKSRRLALRVDRASELARVPRSALGAHGEALPQSELVVGAARLPDGLLVIVDIEAFLDHAEQEALEQALRAHRASEELAT